MVKDTKIDPFQQGYDAHAIGGRNPYEEEQTEARKTSEVSSNWMQWELGWNRAFHEKF